MSPIKILIADDQEAVRYNLRRILESQPDLTVVGEAADGIDAVEFARLLRPDVVLADVRMPRQDGLAVTRQLAGPDVEDPQRVVVITTFELDEYVYTALRNGACGFLLKRSGPALLVEGVRAAVAGDVLISPELTMRLFSRLPLADGLSRSAAGLTDRELDVACLIAQAKTNTEIAYELGVTQGTIKTHVANIQRKLRACNRVAIAAWAWETGHARR